MIGRYLSGLALGFLVIGVSLVAYMMALSVGAGRAPNPLSLVDAWLFVGSATVVMLATVVGPLVLILRRGMGPAFTPVKAALVGAATGPATILIVWFITRESWETVGMLLRFWQRVPMEFLVGVLPFMAAGGLFAAWVVAARGVPRRRVA